MSYRLADKKLFTYLLMLPNDFLYFDLQKLILNYSIDNGIYVYVSIRKEGFLAEENKTITGCSSICWWMPASFLRCERNSFAKKLKILFIK